MNFTQDSPPQPGTRVKHSSGQGPTMTASEHIFTDGAGFITLPNTGPSGGHAMHYVPCTYFDEKENKFVTIHCLPELLTTLPSIS
jgi:hypothetical protein